MKQNQLAKRVDIVNIRLLKERRSATRSGLSIDRMSTFVQELIKEQQVPYEMGIEESKSIRDNPKCPRCLDGDLVIRKQANRKSTFVGCSHYPGCDYTTNHPSIIHNPIVCPSCRGYLVLLDGRNGKFYGCFELPAL